MALKPIFIFSLNPVAKNTIKENPEAEQLYSYAIAKISDIYAKNAIQ